MLAQAAPHDLAIWNNSTGRARIGPHWIQYGLCVGSSDLIGCFAPAGRLIAWEVKAPDAPKPTVEQRDFLALVTRLGGDARVLRSVDDALAALDELRAGRLVLR